MKSKCLNWRGEHLSGFCRNAKVNGLWSIYTVNVRASNICRKCLTAKYTANSSLSNALYFTLDRLNFFEKNANGSQPLSPSCCSTAPTLWSKASVNTANFAPILGCANKAACAKLSFDNSNVCYVCGVHDTGSFSFALSRKRSLYGACVLAAFGKNLL